MSLYIVDSSVAAKWYFPEEYAEAAMRVLDERHSLRAPELFLLEMDSVVCQRLRRGQVTEAKAAEIRTAVRALPITLYPQALLLDSGYEIAKRVRRSPYDCLYLALAELLDGKMVTADLRFYDAIKGISYGKFVLWVEDVE